MMNSYSVEQYVSDIRTAVREENSDAAITARIKPFAGRLAADKSWIKSSYREVDAEQGFGLHLIHEEENHELAVFVISWAPGRGLGPHNHKTWAVVATIEGQERETGYRRIDDESKPGFADLKISHEETLYPGTVVCCMPEDIHSVWNNGTGIAISLHTYGRHLNHTGRSIFNLENKTEQPCIVKVEN